MKGVPASFDVEDELYYLNAEPEKVPAGDRRDRRAGRDVAERPLQEAASRRSGSTSHPKARIVGITLGHDERVHDLAAFKTLLVNAVRWSAGTASK